MIYIFLTEEYYGDEIRVFANHDDIIHYAENIDIDNKDYIILDAPVDLGVGQHVYVVRSEEPYGGDNVGAFGNYNDAMNYINNVIHQGNVDMACKHVVIE
jgi:hypothetical protein